MPVFAIGTALGALLAYFFDPQNGNRRRKLAVDRTAGFLRSRGRETARTGRAVAAEAYGVSQKVEHRKAEPLDLGFDRSAHATSFGKVLLAAMSPTARRHYLAGAYARCRASARWRTCFTFRGPKPACTRASGSPLVLQFAPGGLDRRALGDDELDTLPKDAFEERGVDVGRIGDRDLDPVLADEADGNRE